MRGIRKGARAFAAAFALAGLASSPFAAATNQAVSWAQNAKWPDFTGGVWSSPGAEGSPHAEDLPLSDFAKRLQSSPDIKSHFGSGAASCAPRGMPWSLGNQFFYSHGEIVILGAPDYYMVVRRVYMDGRGHDDPDPTYFGHSIGHWEGDTLVIDTVGFLPEELLTEGLPSYGKTHIVERYRLLKPGSLQLELTVENPVMLTRPWKQTRVYTLDRSADAPETYCTNNRDANGQSDLQTPYSLPPVGANP